MVLCERRKPARSPLPAPSAMMLGQPRVTVGKEQVRLGGKVGVLPESRDPHECSGAGHAESQTTVRFMHGGPS